MTNHICTRISSEDDYIEIHSVRHTESDYTNFIGFPYEKNLIEYMESQYDLELNELTKQNKPKVK